MLVPTLAFLIGVFPFGMGEEMNVWKLTPPPQCGGEFRGWFQTQPKMSFTLLGDMMLSRGVGYMIKKKGIEYITDGYHPLRDIPADSWILANLESPFTDPDKDTAEPTFSFGANTKNVAVLQWLQDDHQLIVSLANNHIMNGGIAGFSTTIETLDQANISHVGLAKWHRPRVWMRDHGSERVCIGAYSYDGKRYLDKKRQTFWEVNTLENARIDIHRMHDYHCTHKIAIVHWWREYRFSPTDAQRRLAYDLIDSGATLIVGAHSHILWEIESYHDRWIVYSWGNAIFDQDWWREGCFGGMDCIYDSELWKNTVPTYRGSAIILEAPYTGYTLSQWNIRVGKMEAISSGSEHTPDVHNTSKK